jgi:hypothetical protein
LSQSKWDVGIARKLDELVLKEDVVCILQGSLGYQQTASATDWMFFHWTATRRRTSPSTEQSCSDEVLGRGADARSAACAWRKRPGHPCSCDSASAHACPRPPRARRRPPERGGPARQLALVRGGEPHDQGLPHANSEHHTDGGIAVQSVRKEDRPLDAGHVADRSNCRARIV